MKPWGRKEKNRQPNFPSLPMLRKQQQVFQQSTWLWERFVHRQWGFVFVFFFDSSVSQLLGFWLQNRIRSDKFDCFKISRIIVVLGNLKKIWLFSLFSSKSVHGNFFQFPKGVEILSTSSQNPRKSSICHTKCCRPKEQQIFSEKIIFETDRKKFQNVTTSTLLTIFSFFFQFKKIETQKI